MKKISIITPTYNEEENVTLLIEAVMNVANVEKIMLLSIYLLIITQQIIQ